MSLIAIDFVCLSLLHFMELRAVITSEAHHRLDVVLVAMDKDFRRDVLIT